jgi:hypothetical protein
LDLQRQRADHLGLHPPRRHHDHGGDDIDDCPIHDYECGYDVNDGCHHVHIPHHGRRIHRTGIKLYDHGSEHDINIYDLDVHDGTINLDVNHDVQPDDLIVVNGRRYHLAAADNDDGASDKHVGTKHDIFDPDDLPEHDAAGLDDNRSDDVDHFGVLHHYAQLYIDKHSAWDDDIVAGTHHIYDDVRAIYDAAAHVLNQRPRSDDHGRHVNLDVGSDVLDDIRARNGFLDALIDYYASYADNFDDDTPFSAVVAAARAARPAADRR